MANYSFRFKINSFIVFIISQSGEVFPRVLYICLVQGLLVVLEQHYTARQWQFISCCIYVIMFKCMPRKIMQTVALTVLSVKFQSVIDSVNSQVMLFQPLMSKNYIIVVLCEVKKQLDNFNMLTKS